MYAVNRWLSETGQAILVAITLSIFFFNMHLYKHQSELIKLISVQHVCHCTIRQQNLDMVIQGHVLLILYSIEL